MATFLNTSKTTYFLEELIKKSSKRLILISPYLKFSDRLKELITDQDRSALDMTIVFGKKEGQGKEIEWLRELSCVRVSFCKNLHAKCYINEIAGIITSLNLHEFSQVNNNEMGVLLRKSDDAKAYKEAYDEAQRIVRISDEVELSTKQVAKADGKLTSSKIARKLGLTTAETLDKLVWLGLLELRDGKHQITPAGQKAGGESRTGIHGQYFLWPGDLDIK